MSTDDLEGVSLDKVLLDALVAEFCGTGVAGLALTGSHARGDAGPHSDLDLLRFSDLAPGRSRDEYQLRYVDDLLVSVSTRTFASKRAELRDPARAIWGVAGLRQARVLYDREGELCALLEEAHAFDWAPLRGAARELLGEELSGCAEEVHKILGALERDDDSALLYASLGLALALAKLVAVAEELVIETENRYFDQLHAAVGADSRWSRLHRLAIGLEAGPAALRPAQVRAIAGLHLYVSTHARVASELAATDAAVVSRACERIASVALPELALRGSS